MNKQTTKNILSYLTQDQRSIVYNTIDNCFGLEYNEIAPECKHCADNVNCSVMFENSEVKGLSEAVYKILNISSIQSLDSNITLKICSLIGNLQKGKPMTENELKAIVKDKMNLDNDYIIDYFTDRFIIENKINIKLNKLYL